MSSEDDKLTDWDINFFGNLTQLLFNPVDKTLDVIGDLLTGGDKDEGKDPPPDAPEDPKEDTDEGFNEI